MLTRAKELGWRSLLGLNIFYGPLLRIFGEDKFLEAASDIRGIIGKDMRLEFHLSNFFREMGLEESASHIIADSELYHIERRVLSVQRECFTILKDSRIRVVDGLEFEVF